MNNVGVYGKLNLQFTDLSTGVTSNEDILNLVTNYGLGRLFGPKEPNEKVANRIYFGFRTEAAAITDDVIPTDWKYIDVKTITLENSSDINVSAANVTIKNKFEASGLFGNSATTDVYLANHAYLAHVGDDGIPHALTSFKIRSDDNPINIQFSLITIVYDMVISYKAMVVVDGVTALKAYKTSANPTIPLNALYEPNAFRPAGVLAADTDNYAIPLTGEWDDIAGIYKQKYKIIVNNVNANTGQQYWFGTAMIAFVVATAGTYELTIEVGRIDPNLNATEVTSIVKHDSSRLRINAAPHQMVQVFVAGTTTNPVSTAYVGIDGTAIINGYSSLFNQGKTYSFVTSAPNGTRASVDITTPDESADPLIAFYRSGPNQFRAIGNRGDKVDIFISAPFTYYQDVLENINVSGTCMTESLDEPGYYYCDIDVDPMYLAYERCRYVMYKNTDLAGNVYTDGTYGRNERMLFVPDMPYEWYKEGRTIQSGTGVSDPKPIGGWTIPNDVNVEIMSITGEII